MVNRRCVPVVLTLVSCGPSSWASEYDLAFLRSGELVLASSDGRRARVLEDEYTLTAATFGWDETVVSDVARCSIEAAFCTEDEKARLLAELDTFLAQLSQES